VTHKEYLGSADMYGFKFVGPLVTVQNRKICAVLAF